MSKDAEMAYLGGDEGRERPAGDEAHFGGDGECRNQYEQRRRNHRSQLVRV